MGIDSNVNNVSKVFGDYKTNSSSTTSSINSSIVDAVEDVAQSFIDHLKEQIEEMKEQIELEADESVNDYLDPSSMTEEDWKKYQDKLNEIIKNSATEKEAIANIAKFMAYEFPKLHYFWGGGHELYNEEDFRGLNHKWGSDEPVVFDLSDGWKEGESFPYSLDCSAFVTWVLINAGVDISKYYEDYNPNGNACLNTTSIDGMGEHYPFGSEDILDVIEPGDIAWQGSHTGIVIDVDKEAGTITVVHVSGSGQGTNVTTFDAKTGLIVDDDLGEMPEFENPYGRSTDNSSPYQEYSQYRGEGANGDPDFTLFTEFIHLD
jgi:hypothetical protein